MYSNSNYVKKREKFIDQALKETFQHCEDIESNEKKDLFNRVFLNKMDKLCYENKISELKPRKMSHEKEIS